MEVKNALTTPSNAAALVERAIAAIPKLGLHHVGMCQTKTGAWSFFPKPEDIAFSQDELRKQTTQVEHCVAWLQNIRPTMRVSRKYKVSNSYACKHYVEAWLGGTGCPGAYIPNGAFIAAAVGLGDYPFSISHGGRNHVYFGFSAPDVTRMSRWWHEKPE